MVSPPTCSELNTATSTLRELERDFITTAATTPDSAAASGTNPLDPPKDLAAAIRRAGPAKYSAYMDRVKNVRIMFASVTDRDVPDEAIPPSYVM